MASFKETFKLERDKKGPGKTFTWTDKNGKTETYSTNYAGEEKKPSGTGTKPKAKPAGLNPKSGASRSTAGKVAAKESVSGASRSTAGKVKPKASMEQQKAAYGANRPATMGSAAKMSQTERAMAEAKAAKAAKDAKAKSKKTVVPATTTAKPKALTPFQRLGNIVAGGGFSNYLKKK